MSKTKEAARIAELEAAIKLHRAQRADDRCIEDDDKLYAVLGDGIPCDRYVGDKAAMLRNCERFIANRCLQGVWPPYIELEHKLQLIREEAQQMIECKLGDGYVALLGERIFNILNTKLQPGQRLAYSDDGRQVKIFGMPVVIDENMPDGQIAFRPFDKETAKRAIQPPPQDAGLGNGTFPYG